MMNLSAAPAVKRIFFAALEITDISERSAYLSEACNGDALLRAQVEQLLKASQEAVTNRFTYAVERMNPQLDESSRDVDDAPEEFDPQLGDSDATLHPIIDRYKILEEIGRGGMGTVYMAQQLEPVKRRVALKVVNPGMDSREVIARFEAERQALAMMDHPNIARVFDGGTTRQGRPYFVMELVRGIPITKYCDKHQLALHDRLKLFVNVCQAVQHAHQKGIIHRDLKPSNVQITNQDGKPLVKVIDFGVAKALNQDLTDRTLYTQFSQLVGTPLYMSPEQADRHGIDIDTRSDVYSLGVLLYELLTGSTPFDREELSKAGIDGARRMICDVEPPRPSVRVSTLKAADDSTLNVAREQATRRRKLGLALRGDLDWIVMKALAKDRNDRFESASAFAQDVLRHLENEPIEAKPPTAFTRLAKWSRRHVALVWSLLAVTAIFALGFGVSTAAITASRNATAEERDKVESEKLLAEQARKVAVHERNSARKNLYYSRMLAGQLDLNEGNLSGLYEQLVDHLPVLDEEDHRDWEWYYLLSRCRSEERGMLQSFTTPFAAWSPDGELIGTSGGIWRADTGERIRRFNASFIITGRVAWSPDGQKFAWGVASDEDCFYVWDRESNQVTRFGGHTGSVWCMGWSPDGSKIASGSIDHTVRVWDVASKTELWSVTAGVNPTSVCWSPDGRQLIVGLHVGGLKVFDAATHALLQHLRMNDYYVFASWHPAGDQLAVCSNRRWFVLDARDWSTVHEETVAVEARAIAYSHDGSRIAVAHGDQISIYDSDYKESLRLAGHLRRVRSVSWSPDDRKLVSSDDRDIKLWQLEQQDSTRSVDLGTQLAALDWARKQTIHAVARNNWKHYSWDLFAGVTNREVPLDISPFHVTRNGRFAIGRRGQDQAFEVYRTSDMLLRAVLRPKADEVILKAALSEDGSRAAIVTTKDSDTFLEIWHIDQESPRWRWIFPANFNKLGHPYAGVLDRIVWSNSGQLLAIKGQYIGEGLQLFSDELQTRVAILPEADDVLCLAWEEEDRALAALNSLGQLNVFDVTAGVHLLQKKVYSHGITAAGWHPAGQRIACGTRDGLVKLVSADQGSVLLTLPTQGESPVTHIAWSKDGQKLAAANERGNITVWDAIRGYELATGKQETGELAWMYHDRASKVSMAQREAANKKFVQLAPDRLAFWEQRGHCFAQLGEFDRAVDEFTKGTDSKPEYSLYPLWCRTHALLAAGRLDEFHRACVELVDVFGDSPVPSTQGIVAWLCALTPNPLIDMERVSEMANFSLEKADRDEPNAVYQGACMYRIGRIAEAVEKLSTVAEMNDRGGGNYARYNLVCAKYLLSLARQDLSHRAQAQRLLAEANELFENLPEDFLWVYWRQRLEMEVLRGEATAALAD